MRILRGNGYLPATPSNETSAAARFPDIVLFAEPLDPAGGVYQLLFTRKERMAGGTNFHLDILNR
jgi:hypothetical protein